MPVLRLEGRGKRVRRLLFAIAIAAAVSVPAAIVYAALRALQLLALGLAFPCFLSLVA